MRAYYNENDAGAAAWLRELIRAGLIADGDVDERSIADVQPSDVRGYQRVQLFAGIAGWDYALQLAGWPIDRPVWTGSCPCQPFSSAGKQEGHGDARNLWPEMLRLIRECRPDTIFGEQVASAIGHGWIDGVCTDLEAEGYACGQIVLPACSVGAPHIRQRLWWVAESNGGKSCDGDIQRSGEQRQQSADGGAGIVADRHGERCERERIHILERGSREDCPEASGRGEAGIVAITEIDRASDTPEARQSNAKRHGATVWLDQPALVGNRTPADAGSDRESEVEGRIGIPGGSGATDRVGNADLTRPQGRNGSELQQGAGELPAGSPGSSGFWSDFILIPCRDGKSRRAKPGIFPLAARLPGRVVALRGAGNSINPWCAEAFIRAYLESEGR